MSITSEITRLQNAKTDIKTAIAAKGVEIPNTAKLDEYDTYIEEIPSGGSIETLDDLNNAIQSYSQNLRKHTNTYPTLLNIPITLYTPDTNYRDYIIFRTLSGSYRIGWLPTGIILAGPDEGRNAYKFSIVYYSPDQNITFQNSPVAYYIGTNTYPTIQQCIDALQNSSTTYKTNTNIALNGEAPYKLPCTSTVLVRHSGLVEQTQRISSNEIIEVIS